jgi:hypothetical protein
MLRTLRTAAILAFAAALACSDPNARLPASIENVLDTITLYSLTSGPLNKPTAYSLNGRPPAVRTWEVGTSFEFAFSMENTGRAVFLTLDVLGLASTNSVKPGLMRSDVSFDAMTSAPSNGYVTSDTIVATEGDRFFLRTGINACAGLGVPLYGKLEVLDIDTAAQTVQFQVIADQNCGYRGLKIGIPKN